MSATRGGGGGGGVGETITVGVWFPVSLPVSFTSIVTISVPGTAHCSCAIVSYAHGVSQASSMFLTHRTWNSLDGSYAANEADAKVMKVAGTPLAGVHLMAAYCGVFVGGGGGGG